MRQSGTAITLFGGRVVIESIVASIASRVTFANLAVS